MFGYVAANLTSLSDTQRELYKSYYCGLCGSIGSLYGTTKRISLTYDTTFLSLLLSSLYELDERKVRCRCPAHPFKRHHEIYTEATDYAAAVNILLAYYKCLDDRQDDHSPISALCSGFLHNAAIRASEMLPTKAEYVKNKLSELKEAEAQNLQDPDLCAKLFGQLLGEIFTWKDDRWSPLLQQMGEFLGQYIYLADAIIDLPKDIKKHRYNPLSSRWSVFRKEDYFPLLRILMGECTAAFECLPLLRHIDLLRNILYDGVWLRIQPSEGSTNKEVRHVR